MTTASHHDDTLRADLASLRIERGAAPTRKPPRRRLPIVIVLVVLAGAVAWMFTSRPAQVRVAYAALSTPAQSGPVPVLSGSGYVVTGDRYVSIGVRVPGRIDRYFVEEGQSVRKGDALVQIDDRDYRAAAARAEANLELVRANLGLAEADLARGTTLQEGGVISKQEFDVFRNKAEVARASVAQTTAELAQAKVNLEYTTLRAPTDGVILAKLKEVGEIAVPGGFAGSGDLIRLANLNDIRAEVDVNEADLNRVHMGQPAEVTPDAYPDARYPAEVVKLYPQVDRQKGTLKIEVHIPKPDARLLPDMSARIAFLSEPAPPGQAEAAVVLAPAAALRRDERGDTFVWIVADGRVHRGRVETAGNIGDRVRIASGLKGGEALVLGDPPLRDGQRVTVAE
jgi:RND family efflux transporter MFP subunit